MYRLKVLFLSLFLMPVILSDVSGQLPNTLPVLSVLPDTAPSALPDTAPSALPDTAPSALPDTAVSRNVGASSAESPETIHTALFSSDEMPRSGSVRQRGVILSTLARQLGTPLPAGLERMVGEVRNVSGNTSVPVPFQDNQVRRIASHSTERKDVSVRPASAELPVSDVSDMPALDMPVSDMPLLEISAPGTSASDMPVEMKVSPQEADTAHKLELPVERPPVGSGGNGMDSVSNLAPLAPEAVPGETLSENTAASDVFTLTESEPAALPDVGSVPLTSEDKSAEDQAEKELPDLAPMTLVPMEPVEKNLVPAETFPLEPGKLDEEPGSAPVISPVMEAEVAGRELQAGTQKNSTRNNVPETIKGNGLPGPAGQEGPQAPLLVVEKIAPREIQVGKASVWEIHVRNEGKNTVRGVQIQDPIPRGTYLVQTSPAATKQDSGSLFWDVGDMPGGTMTVVRVELVPTQEGEIGSVASVVSRSESSAKSVATRPLLILETSGNQKVLVGQPLELVITVSNPGTGVVRNVVLNETVPQELQFSGGAELSNAVGTLNPGEKRMIKLPLQAVRPGKFINTITATADANLRAESRFQMEVTAPKLEVVMDGPGKRFLEKEGEYSVTVSNRGTASANMVDIKVALPAGLMFIRADNAGTFLAEQRMVCWRLKELSAGDSATVHLTTVPQQPGQLSMRYEAQADICPVVSGEKTLKVEGIAALMFQVTDTHDPVQLGEETVYEIKVVNQGSRAAENVAVAVTVPAGIQILACDGPTQFQRVQNEIIFSPLAQLNAKSETKYILRAQGFQIGDQRVRVKLSSREFPTPIVKEESTRVYGE